MALALQQRLAAALRRVHAVPGGGRLRGAAQDQDDEEWQRFAQEAQAQEDLQA